MAKVLEIKNRTENWKTARRDRG